MGIFLRTPNTLGSCSVLTNNLLMIRPVPRPPTVSSRATSPPGHLVDLCPLATSKLTYSTHLYEVNMRLAWPEQFFKDLIFFTWTEVLGPDIEGVWKDIMLFISYPKAGEFQSRKSKSSGLSTMPTSSRLSLFLLRQSSIHSFSNILLSPFSVMSSIMWKKGN